MMSLKIAIVGAGPAGCTLARILTQSSVASRLNVTIFEGEKSLDVRSQGGTLDLRKGAGLDAIYAANLENEFRKVARFQSDAMLLCDKHLTAYLKKPASKEDKDSSSPEIDRSKLRKLLLDSLPSGIVQWSKKLKEVKESTDSNYSLHFADDTVADGYDLVIGADGGWSKVRPLVSNVKPHYSGVSGHLWRIDNASKTIPDVSKKVNEGSIATMDDQKMLGLQSLDDDVMHSSTWFAEPNERWTESAPYNVKDAVDIRKYTLEHRFASWDSFMKIGIQNANLSKTLTLTLYELPVDYQWKHRRGATLVGDAAHLMTPFGGDGVNQALTDCNVLGREIVGAITKLDSAASRQAYVDAADSAVTRYEKEMFPRAQKSMRMTHANKTVVFLTPGGLRANIEKIILSLVGEILPLKAVTLPLASLIVYTYFFIFRLFH